MVVGVHPVARNEAHFTIRHHVNRRLGNRGFAAGSSVIQRFAGQIHVPLIRQVRFDHRAGTVATRNHQLVVFDFVQQAERVHVRDDLLTRRKAFQTLIFFRCYLVDAGINGKNINQRQVVTLAHLIVVEIVCRGNFHTARAFFWVSVIVAHHRNQAPHQRQHHVFANQMLVALVFRVHRHGGVTQHGFRARGGNDQEFVSGIARRIRQRVAEVPHIAVFFFGHNFKVGNSGVQHGIPIHQAFAAIDQAFFMQAHEHFTHRLRQAFIHRKAFA